MDLVPIPDHSERQACLSLILKTIRRRRGFRSSELARQMTIGLRTYQRFESGAMGLDLEKIHQFADLVNADGWAIVFGVEMNSVEFALNCTENKAASALLVALRRFNRTSGKDLARLDPRSVMLVFNKMLNEISVRAREYDADLEQWMFDEALNGDPDDDDQK
jgi:transcriptional regulator with XRE-family HTH domain